MPITQLQEAIGYTFRHPELLAVAMTHSSYANERDDIVEHNERLEFLGDAVLELCVSAELYGRFTQMREGSLTRMRAQLVSQPSLAAIAHRCGVHNVLLLGKGEEAQGGRDRPSLLSDAFEALLGAIFLDGGFDAVREVVRSVIDQWPDEDAERKNKKDNKSLLQEVTQRLYKERPLYTLVDSYGPEHEKVFTVRITLPGNLVFTCDGPSVKRAEQLAARMALDHLNTKGAPEVSGSSPS